MHKAEKKRTNRKFSYDEDRALRRLVKQFGESSWDEISKHMNERNPRQCHDRWCFYLSPKINHSPWTDEEDKRLIKAYTELNGKWVQISKRFKGRTDTQIKNRWNTLNKLMHLPKIEKKKIKHANDKITNSDKTSDDNSENNHLTTIEEESKLLASGVVDKFISLFEENDHKNDWALEFLV